MSGGHERVFRALIADIAEARVRPGDRLPSEATLAERFGVSVAAAQRATRDLDSRGLASVSRDGAITVAPEARWDILDPCVLGCLLESAHGPGILDEWLEYRRVAEVLAAGLAAENATAADLSRLSDALAAMAEAAERAPGDPAEEARFHEADVEFHQALVAAGANRPLALATESLSGALCTARRPLARPELRFERGLPEHQQLLAAVARGDAEAARAAMSAHLGTVETYLREYAGTASCGSETSARPNER